MGLGMKLRTEAVCELRVEQQPPDTFWDDYQDPLFIAQVDKDKGIILITSRLMDYPLAVGAVLAHECGHIIASRELILESQTERRFAYMDVRGSFLVACESFSHDREFDIAAMWEARVRRIRRGDTSEEEEVFCDCCSHDVEDDLRNRRLEADSWHSNLVYSQVLRRLGYLYPDFHPGANIYTLAGSRQPRRR